MSTPLLDTRSTALALGRIAGEILERGGLADLAIVGVRRGGEPFAKRLAGLLAELDHGPLPPVGSVDITLYRDDAATAWPNPRIGPTELPFSVAGKRIVLVDDVVSTGRTTRAAVDAILDYGRPARIEFCALVDRGGRELPIQPDYVGKRVSVLAEQRVEMVFQDERGEHVPFDEGVAGKGQPVFVVMEEGEAPPPSGSSR